MSISSFRAQRDALFTRDIPQAVKDMATVDLQRDIKSEAFIDPFKYLELKRRGAIV
jgi:hypothetical protein